MTEQATMAFHEPLARPPGRGESREPDLIRDEPHSPELAAGQPDPGAAPVPEGGLLSPVALKSLIEAAAAAGPQSGDAFTRLVTLYRPRVISLVAALLGDSDQAEDVAQDAFMKAHAGLSGFRFESRFDTWLFRIACRTAIDHTRRSWWRKRVSLDGLTEPKREQAILDHSTARPSAVRPDPEMDLLRAERARIVQRALREVPMSYRAAVVLKDLADLPYEEIGRILGCPLGTVESRIHRGRLVLRKKLEKALP